MADQTLISWAHATFNPWWGCAKISPACANCYAATWAKRCGRPELWATSQRWRTSEKNWAEPLKWDRQARAEGKRIRVFCASMADVFDNEVDPQWRAALFQLISRTPNLDWLLLSKRIGNAHSMIDAATASDYYPAWSDAQLGNVWLGATIANQAEADRDIPKLLATPARVRFLSIEPMLGPVNLTRLRPPDLTWLDALSGRAHDGPSVFAWGSQVDWVIAGGESGHQARPSHPDWFRSLRDQCVAAGVPYHFKQWGEWWPMSQMPDGVSDSFYDPKYGNGKRESDRYERSPPKRRAVTTTVLQLNGTESFEFPPGAMTCFKVGKKAAGRTLDGCEWDQFPEPRL